MKRRSLSILTGLGLLDSTSLAACPDGKPAREDSTSASKLETLRVHVPTTLAFMVPMASSGTFGKLDGLAGKADVQSWAGVDVMKSPVVSGETDLVATPSYAAANLFNKGLPVRLVAMTVWGMLYILDPEGSSAQGIRGLKGKKVGVLLFGNIPDLVFRYLMTQSGTPLEGGAESIEVVPYDQVPGLVKALMSGQVEYAVLPEHIVTVAQNQAKQSGKNLDRTANLQEIWAKVIDGQARFPMANVMMPQKPVDSNQAFVAGMLNELEEAVTKVNALNGEAVMAIAVKTEVPKAVVEGVVPRLRLEMVPAQKAKIELEDFYTCLTTLSLDIVGGRTPVGDFYLADPRWTQPRTRHRAGGSCYCGG